MKIFPARASLLASLVAVVTMGLIASAARTPQGSSASRQEQQDWPAYGGAPENNHYSTLAHINRSNVKLLAVAWTFDTQEEGGLLTCPIIVVGVLSGIALPLHTFAHVDTYGILCSILYSL